MNLKYIILPKPDASESTIIKRVGLVFYWIGSAWLVAFFAAFLFMAVSEILVLTSDRQTNLKPKFSDLQKIVTATELKLRAMSDEELDEELLALKAGKSPKFASNEELITIVMHQDEKQQRLRIAEAWDGIGNAFFILGFGIPVFFIGRGLLFILANR